MSARTRGFTVLEILVALSILAVGLAAASRAVMASTDSAAALQARQLAGWVAQNELALLRASRGWPEPGVRSGSTPMGTQRFQWRMQVSPAVQNRFRRIELQVSAEGQDEVLAQLVGFLPEP